MHWFSLAVALLAALAIILIGLRYLTDPRAMAPSFGLPLPEQGVNTTWWLRLKGVRDTTSGVLVLAFMAVDGHRALGLVLLVSALSRSATSRQSWPQRAGRRRPWEFTG